MPIPHHDHDCTHCITGTHPLHSNDARLTVRSQVDDRSESATTGPRIAYQGTAHARRVRTREQNLPWPPSLVHVLAHEQWQLTRAATLVPVELQPCFGLPTPACCPGQRHRRHQMDAWPTRDWAAVSGVEAALLAAAREQDSDAVAAALRQVVPVLPLLASAGTTDDTDDAAAHDPGRYHARWNSGPGQTGRLPERVLQP